MEVCLLYILYYPIKAESHFFRPILLKLAGNVKNGKNKIPLFCFSLNTKITKIFAIEFFQFFLTVYIYSDTKVDQILTVHRKQPVESKSVEIFGLSLMVFELEVFSFSYFLTVCTYSVMTLL
jgi:hypothetical protein